MGKVFSFFLVICIHSICSCLVFLQKWLFSLSFSFFLPLSLSPHSLPLSLPYFLSSSTFFLPPSISPFFLPFLFSYFLSLSPSPFLSLLFVTFIENRFSSIFILIRVFPPSILHYSFSTTRLHLLPF